MNPPVTINDWAPDGRVARCAGCHETQEVRLRITVLAGIAAPEEWMICRQCTYRMIGLSDIPEGGELGR